MKIYISGPISKRPNCNREAFSFAQSMIENAGHEAVNPLKLPNDGTWQHAMKQDIKALMDCDRILMLDGWEDSRGADIEKYLADVLGIKEIKIFC